MPTPTKGPRLGGSPAHERLMLANLATALFEHGRITTTAAKAKRLRPFAERLITFAKRGDLHARRQVMTVVGDPDVAHHLFAEIGPRYASRPGGYTRIVKVGNRKGDNAPMAVIELVEGLTVAQEAVDEAERARGTRFGRSTRAQEKVAALSGETADEAGDQPAEGVTSEQTADAADTDPAEGSPEAAEPGGGTVDDSGADDSGADDSGADDSGADDSGATTDGPGEKA